jgi:hypothetical protein
MPTVRRRDDRPVGLFLHCRKTERASASRASVRPRSKEGTPSMDLRIAATGIPDPDAVEFIRFCYRRRRVGWPELYDEMCGVAARGLFRGLVTDDLAEHGIGFSLFDMPALAVLAQRIVVEEQAARRPVTVVIAPVAAEEVAISHDIPVVVEPAATVVESLTRTSVEPTSRSEAPVRFAAVPAGA